MDNMYNVDAGQRREILRFIRQYLIKGLAGCLAIPIIIGAIFSIALYIVGEDIQYACYGLVIALVLFAFTSVKDTYMFIKKFSEYRLLKKYDFRYSIVEADALLLDSNLFRWGKYNLNILKYHYNRAEEKAFTWDGPAMKARKDMRLVLFVPQTGGPVHIVYPMYHFEHVLDGGKHNQ